MIQTLDFYRRVPAYCTKPTRAELLVAVLTVGSKTVPAREERRHEYFFGSSRRTRSERHLRTYKSAVFRRDGSVECRPPKRPW